MVWLKFIFGFCINLTTYLITYELSNESIFATIFRRVLTGPANSLRLLRKVRCFLKCTVTVNYLCCTQLTNRSGYNHRREEKKVRECAVWWQTQSLQCRDCADSWNHFCFLWIWSMNPWFPIQDEFAAHILILLTETNTVYSFYCQ